MTLSDPLNPLNSEMSGALGVGLPTVGDLIAAVGSPVLHVLAAPHGTHQWVSGTVLHDPIDELPDEPDSMLLMSGIRAEAPEAIDLLRAAADKGYCAVIVKRRGAEISALVAEASVRGVVVLAAADEVPWRHLDALLLSVLGSSGLADEPGASTGDELFAVANAIAGVMRGSVAIEDMDRRVVAYSSLADQRIDALREQGILNRRVPDMERNPEQYRAVLAADGVVRFPEKVDEYARAAIAIKAGERPLGTIWAIEGPGGIDADGERTLVEGAHLAALKILRGLNANSLELQLREAALIRAIDGLLAADEITFRLSLPGGVDLCLVGFAARTDRVEPAPLVTHLASALARHIAAYRPDASMATTARAVYVLLPGGGAEPARRFAAGALGGTQQVFADAVCAALSFCTTDASELPAMRREIDDILRVTTAQAEHLRVAALDDVHTSVLLSHFGDVLVHEPRLRHGGVDAMVAWDADHRTDYVVSVTAWFDAGGDVGVAAARLGVHANTLRYRLRRAAEMFDIALDGPDDRLLVWMQLRLVP